MLILFAPGPPREDYVQELAAIRSSGRTLTSEDWIALWEHVSICGRVA